MYNRHVVVVEDEALLRDLIAKTLESSGFDVTTAANAADAARAFKAHDPDAVVLDVELPEMTPQIVKQLESNQVASACASEVVREAVSNAVKHGKAEHVVIALEQTNPHLLGITVTNDGQPLPAEIEAGYGSTILDEVAFAWQLENRGGFTVLGAAIAI